MIDEKKLIDELDKIIDLWKNGYGEKKEDLCFSIVDLKNIVNNQPQIGTWILCSDRLPTMEECQKNDCRFILDDGNRRYDGLFDYKKKCFTQFDFWRGLVEDKCAIAWQSLPESYTENQKD